ncbi:hypothetical protein CL614_01050 [archaeon]|nr:hypothetical protein [archaeon]|tara:strand:+ start:377 stop:1228 length:852 start_codon:yes stop_codon:yes gene_type:complete
MRLAIIGDPDRFEKDKCILEKAKEIYKTAFYVPITEIMIETGEGSKLLHRGKDISEFDSVLPIPTGEKKDLFAAVIEVLANKKIYLPYTFETLSIMKWRALSLSILRLGGFDVPDMYFMLSSNMVDALKDKIDYPADVFMGGDSITVDNEKELKMILKVKKGPGVYILEQIEGKRIECLVAGDEFVASVEKTGKKMTKVVAGKEKQKIAIEVIKELGSVYGSVTFKGDKIIGVSLSPDFGAIGKAAAKDISGDLLEHLAKNIHPKQESVFTRVLKAMKKKEMK